MNFDDHVEGRNAGKTLSRGKALEEDLRRNG